MNSETGRRLGETEENHERDRPLQQTGITFQLGLMIDQSIQKDRGRNGCNICKERLKTEYRPGTSDTQTEGTVLFVAGTAQDGSAFVPL
jgi:hypothetical protein